MALKPDQYRIVWVDGSTKLGQVELGNNKSYHEFWTSLEQAKMSQDAITGDLELYLFHEVTGDDLCTVVYGSPEVKEYLEGVEEPVQ